MCFVIGGVGVEKEKWEKILPYMSLRGRDGYGYFILNEEKNSIIKRSIQNPEEIKSLPNWKTDIFLANSRAIPAVEYSTGAGFDIENQQPFTSEEKRFYVVQNGIISNDKELITTYNLNPKSKVDSAILPYLFDKVGVIEGIKLIKGSFAILCWDDKERIFYAAKNFMPLSIFTIDEGEEEDEKGIGVGFISLIEALKDVDYDRCVEIPPYSCIKVDIGQDLIETISLYPKERNKRVLVICSGGADSTTTAYIYKHLGYEVGLIHFKYGQAAQDAEEFCVKKIAQKLKAELYIYDAKSIFGIFKEHSLLLNQKKPDKSKQLLDSESMLSYVPVRNSLMAMIAAGVAEIHNYDTVAIGVQQEDGIYIDNNPGFVDAVNELYRYSMKWGTNIHFTGPIVHLIKHEIFSLGKKLGVDFINDSTSCYYPKVENGKLISCHGCGCCIYKDNALKMIRERDTISNVDEFINKYVKPFA